MHSLHAYFLRAGDPDLPIVYEVDRSRDGASFSSRRVVAIQRGEQIFHMSASFQIAEEAIDRQGPMPLAPDPESLPDMAAAVEELKQQGAGSAAALSCAEQRVRVSAGGVAGSDGGDSQGTAHEDLVSGDRPRAGR